VGAPAVDARADVVVVGFSVRSDVVEVGFSVRSDVVVVPAVVLVELEELAPLGLGVEVRSSGNCKVG